MIRNGLCSALAPGLAYILKNLLNLKRIPSLAGLAYLQDDNRGALLKKLEDNNITMGEHTFKDYTNDDYDKDIIMKIVSKVLKNGRIKNPSITDKYVLEKYGYCYAQTSENFVHLRAVEKLYGKKHLSDYTYFCFSNTILE